jgi:hypothetical protein
MDFNIEQNIVNALKKKLIKNLKQDKEFMGLDIDELIVSSVNKICDNDLGDIDYEINKFNKNNEDKIVSEEKNILKRIINLNLPIEIEKENNKRGNSGERYEKYKIATNHKEYLELGGLPADFIYDYKKGFIKVLNI